MTKEQLRQELQLAYVERQQKEEIEEIQNEIDELEEQKRRNEWLIDYYENRD